MGNRLPRRRVDPSRVHERLAAARAQPVKLRVAACLLHHELGGRSRSSMRGAQYLEEVNAAAAELARIAELYRLERGRAVPIPKEELAGAVFLDGGNILRTAAGTLYRPIALLRAEAIEAIGVLVSGKEAAKATCDPA
jgi:hypothetical protein